MDEDSSHSRRLCTTMRQLKKDWQRAWDELPQEQIQAWIERIMTHIKEVIGLEGGNEYREGRGSKDHRHWKGKRVKGKLSTLVHAKRESHDTDEEEIDEIEEFGLDAVEEEDAR
jgi:hypothetical protein